MSPTLTRSTNLYKMLETVRSLGNICTVPVRRNAQYTKHYPTCNYKHQIALCSIDFSIKLVNGGKCAVKYLASNVIGTVTTAVA